MRCSQCHREMRPLFTSCVCDHCDGLVAVETYRGFIVYRGPADLRDRSLYVFPTRTDAALWRSATGLSHCPILEVLCETPFAWRRSSGSIGDLELADRLYEVYPDHRFPPAPDRAYLAPAARAFAAA